MSKQRKKLRAALLDALRPPPRLTVSQWADRHRILPDDESEAGPWRTSRTPYLREPMDALTPDDPTRVVVLMKGSQTGGTEALCLNTAGYWIHHAPGRILMVRPDEDDARDFSAQRLQPMLDLTPELQQRVADGKTDNKLLKDFPGGSLKITGARAPAGLRSKPVPYVIGDEIDNWPQSAGAEGDPLYLAMKRQTNYPDRKTALVSTPLDDESSRVLLWWLRGDRCTYWLPCPDCEDLFVLEWALFVIPEDENGTKQPDDVFLACPHCGVEIRNEQKATMLPAGQWRPLDTLTGDERAAALRTVGLSDADGVDVRVDTTPRDRSVRSFHLSSLYSPVGWLSWSGIAHEFLNAAGDPTKLRGVVNTALGQVWRRSDGKTISAPALYERREVFDERVPRSVAFITAGVDVQGDRLEVEIVGWSSGFESWSLDYLLIPGDPTGRDVWRDLDAVLLRTYPLAGGGDLRIEAACIDSGFEAHRVYEFCRPRWKRRIWAIKGASEGDKVEGEIWPHRWGQSKRKTSAAVKFKRIGTKRAKRHIYERLEIETPGPGFCHVPDDRGLWWYHQLTAERFAVKYHRGRAFRVWSVDMEGPSRGRNEALDCRVYAYAAAIGLESAGRIIDEVLKRRAVRDGDRSIVDQGTRRPHTKRRRDTRDLFQGSDLNW